MEPTPTPADDAPLVLLNEAEVCRRLAGISPSTLQRMVARGHFPEPYRISERVRGWRERDVDDWIRSLPRWSEVQ